MIILKGSIGFKQRIICATLSGKSVKIEDIRLDVKEEEPGLKDYEILLLRLIDNITNGSKIQINKTGTSVEYNPGIITGGNFENFDCGKSRSIGYFLELLVLISLFGKKPFSIELKGATSDDKDLSVDIWRTVTLPLISKICNIEEGFELKLIKRGVFPECGGKIKIEVPIIREVPCIHMTEEGMVKKIRGVAYSLKVSVKNTNRIVSGVKSILNDFLSDVHIFTDAITGKNSGKSPGYGVNLVAQTTSGTFLSSEACINKLSDSSNDLNIPENLGKYVACSLLNEIKNGGVVDSYHQPFCLLFCAMGAELLNEIRLGPLSDQAINMLRNIKEFFNVVFKLNPEKMYGTVSATCIGIGVKNLARKIA